MFAEIKKIIQQDRKLQLILLGGLIIQIITSITAIGFSNFDQHFSVVEFSSWQLGNENAASYAFELDAKIRPTLQVYLFTGYYKVCMFAGIEDPYQQLTILRVILGLTMFLVFNLIAFFYFKEGNRKILYYVLLILNFSWIFPYTRTLYSSEMLSGLFLFGTIFLYEAKRNKNPSFGFLVLVGFLFSLAFYFRFQTGLALAGFGLWFLLFEKKYARLIPLVLGFLLGFAINTYLDYKFYHEFVLSPYRYFQWNIVEGKSAEFGTSSFLKYIGLLIAVITVPPFSLILFYYSIKTYFKKYNNPVFIPVLLFIIGHCLIGHKEERFLYPIFSALPVIIGYGLPDLINYYKTCKRWIASFIKVLLIITIVVNTIVLILFTSIPYSQTIYFSKVLKNKFEDKPATVYCLYRTPFETMSGIPMVFYRKGAKNLELKKISYIDSLRSLTGDEIFIATTFNESKLRRGLFDSLGYKPVMYSSKLLWNINEFLQSKKIKNTINDVWVLYKKKREEYQTEKDSGLVKIGNNDAGKNIKFDFTAKNINSPMPAVEVDATLYNNRGDTIYFLATSCNGVEDGLQYDTAKFSSASFFECVYNFLVIEKIAPNGKYKFKGRFKNKGKFSTIKLGFDFYEVDKAFDLEKADPNILYNKQREKNIVWSDEKQIDK